MGIPLALGIMWQSDLLAVTPSYLCKEKCEVAEISVSRDGIICNGKEIPIIMGRIVVSRLRAIKIHYIGAASKHLPGELRYLFYYDYALACHISRDSDYSL